MMEVLALIPARGGSKSIPRKNLLMLAGKPMLAYSIEHAQSAQSVTRIIVSTEDAEIKAVALAYGAEVIDRPAEYAADTSWDIEVFEHALNLLHAQNYMPQLIVHLRPTTPLRRKGDIDKAVAMLAAAPEFDSLRSVSPAKESPYKMWRMGGGRITPIMDHDLLPLMHALGDHGKPEHLWESPIKERHSMPRQLLDQVYHQNGYIDVIRPLTILNQHRMAGENVMPFVVEHDLFELDYPTDIQPAERAVRYAI